MQLSHVQLEDETVAAVLEQDPQTQTDDAVISIEDDSVSTLEEQVIKKTEGQKLKDKADDFITEAIAKLGMAVEATEYHYVFKDKNTDLAPLLHVNSTMTGKLFYLFCDKYLFIHLS